MRAIALLAALALIGCPKNAPQDGGAVDPEPTPEPTPAPPPADPLNARIEVLDNGLTVMIAPNPEEPRFFSRVVVRAGGAQDPRDATGMAHYLEHLLANKGTTKLGTTDWAAEKPHLDRIRDLYDALFAAEAPEARAELYRQIGESTRAAAQYGVANELKQVYGLLGARGLNAFTSSDQTSYIVDLPANRLGAWTVLEGDRFSNPVFRSFQTEVETVFEEKNRSLDHAGRALTRAFSAAMYGDHPYGTPVLGDVEHLKNPSVSKTEAFFARWYVPGNMAVVLAGDLDPEAALAAAREAFGGLEPAEVPPLEDVAVPAIAGRTLVETTHRGQPGLFVGWHTVPPGHADEAALELAAELLANGATGLFDTELVQTEALRGAGAWASGRRLAGYFGVSARPREGQTLEEAEALLIEQVERLKAGDFDADLLAAIVRNEAVDDARALHTNRGRAGALATAFVFGRSWEQERIRRAARGDVTAADVIRVAKAWLGEDRVVAYRRTGDPDLPILTAPDLGELPVRTDARSALQDRVLQLPADPLVPQELKRGVDYARADTPSGPVYLSKNPHDDLVRLTWRWYVGSEADPLLCDALRLWERAGAGELDRTAVEAKLYELAATVEVSCGTRTVDVRVFGPAASLAETLALVEARLRDPRLDPADVQKQLEDRVERRRQDRTTLGWASGALRAWALDGEDSAWFGGAPTDDQIRSLANADLATRTRRLLSLRRTTLYSGPQEEFELTRLLARPDALWDDPAEQAARTYQSPKRPRILLLDHDSAQATVELLVPDVPWAEEEYALRRLWNEYMSGSAGLVFQEIREARGWAYRAGATYASGWRVGDQNLLRAHVGTQPDKAADVAQLLLSLVRSPPDDAARWSRSKSSALEKARSHRVTFTAAPATAEAWRLKGHGVDPRPERLRALRTPGLEDLARWSDRLADAPFTLAIVGDVERMDLRALEKLARIERVELDQISR